MSLYIHIKETKFLNQSHGSPLGADVSLLKAGTAGFVGLNTPHATVLKAKLK